MKKELTLILILFLCLKTNGQSSILSIAKKASNQKFVISNYNKPNSENGIIILEEFHDLQLENAGLIKRVMNFDSLYNKIAVEGLYHHFNCHRFMFDDSTKDLQIIYDNLILSYLLGNNGQQISNAEYLFLTTQINLLKVEDSLTYSIPEPFNDLNIPSNIKFTSCENNISYLETLYSNESNQYQKTLIKKKLDFDYVVSRRTDTMSSYAINYYNSYQKLFFIIGASHSSKFIAKLKKADIPFVVFSERENLDILRTPIYEYGIRKPQPFIDKIEFQTRFQQDFLKRLYSYQLNTGRRKWISSINKIINQFNLVQEIKFNVNRSLSYKLNGRTFTILPTSNEKESISLSINLESIIAKQYADIFQIDNKVAETPDIPDKSLMLENIHERLCSALREYLTSADYLAKRSKLKNFFQKSNGMIGNSTETDWTDDILPTEINARLSKTLEIQNSISKGKRPDWTLSFNDKNWLGEVKYIRNKSSFEYAFKLLYDDQIEKYILDSLLNPQKLSILILVDNEGLKNLGVPDWKLNYFKSLMEVYIKFLIDKYGIEIKFEIFEVLLLNNKKLLIA